MGQWTSPMPRMIYQKNDACSFPALKEKNVGVHNASTLFLEMLRWLDRIRYTGSGRSGVQLEDRLLRLQRRGDQLLLFEVIDHNFVGKNIIQHLSIFIVAGHVWRLALHIFGRLVVSRKSLIVRSSVEREDLAERNWASSSGMKISIRNLLLEIIEVLQSRMYQTQGILELV